MLTTAQIRWIETHGVSVLHDYWLTSLSSGEPFLEKGVLSYYDGQFVTVCGSPFHQIPPASHADLRSIISKWASDRGVQGIAFLGPQSPTLGYLKEYGFRQTYLEDGRELSSELFIDCSKRAGAIFDQRIYRRSKNLKFESQMRQGGIVSAEYLSLIELFYFARDLTGYLADLAFAFSALLQTDKVQFIEARKNGRLCGFVGFHKPFRNIATAFWITHDHLTPGVCDFLYAKMVEQVMELGAKYVNIGSSPTDGHYRFKRKWGGNPGVPAYNYAEWARGKLARRHYKTWGPRILKL